MQPSALAVAADCVATDRFESSETVLARHISLKRSIDREGNRAHLFRVRLGDPASRSGPNRRGSKL